MAWLASGRVSPYIIIYMTALVRYSNILGVLFFCLKHIVEAGKIFYRYHVRLSAGAVYSLKKRPLIH